MQLRAFKSQSCLNALVKAVHEWFVKSVRKILYILLKYIQSVFQPLLFALGRSLTWECLVKLQAHFLNVDDLYSLYLKTY